MNFDGFNIYTTALSIAPMPNHVKDRFFYDLIQSKIFLIDEDSFRSSKNLPTHLAHEEFDLPFESCYFELTGDNFLTSFGEYNCAGILVKERSPGTYSVSYSLTNAKKKQIFWYCYLISKNFEKADSEITKHLSTLEKVRAEDMIEKSRFWSQFISVILRVIHNSKYGIEKPNRHIQIKHHTQGKYKHRLSEIIRISSEKNTKNQTPSISGREIQWLNRWWTRGHWRKHDGLGKNRAGERVVEGNTWVTEHLKGPESCPIINKTYQVTA